GPSQSGAAMARGRSRSLRPAPRDDQSRKSHRQKTPDTCETAPPKDPVGIRIRALSLGASAARPIRGPAVPRKQEQADVLSDRVRGSRVGGARRLLEALSRGRYAVQVGPFEGADHPLGAGWTCSLFLGAEAR